jgi:protein scribble
MKLNGNQGVTQQQQQPTYPIEEIKLMKQGGAMGLSIVGGGNVACHPFGVDRPGIFISKIVPDGPASRTPLRVGDRLLKVIKPF